MRLKRRPVRLNNGVIIIGSFCLFMACLAIFFLYMETTIKLLESDIRQNEEELVKLKKIVGNIEGYKADKKILENKIKVISTLEEGRTFPVTMLEQLTAIVPVKDLWLDKVSQTGSSLMLEGKARNTLIVAMFMKSLETLPFLSSVDLLSSQQDTISGVNVQSFKLNCAIKKG